MHQKQAAKKLVALTFIFSMALCVFSLQTGNAAKTVVVPDNYPTISAAVANVSAGDTIIVKSGVYHENVVVNKPLTLISETPQAAVVIGAGGLSRGQSTVFTLASDQVQILGFRIESLNYSTVSNCATGISVEGDGCTITGNNIRNNYYGIFCSARSSTLISGNTITGNFKDGVRFCGGFQNTIQDNNITGNAQSGIAIEGYSNTITRNNITGNNRAIGVGCSYSLIFGNSINGNTESGLYFAGSNNTVCANDISGSKWGIYFTPYFAAPNGNKIYQNNFINNEGNVGGSSPYNIQLWYNGAEGNYWNDYNGTGAAPYVIGANNTDNHPLPAPVDISTASQPSTTPPPTANPDSTVALWPFDTVEPNGVTPDETGLNSAVVGSTAGNVSYTPKLVTGKFGKALSFDGAAYVSAPISPSLIIPGEITIDAWINVQQFKDVEYNNIFVEAARSRASLPERTVGLAVNGLASDNGTGVPVGALRAYVTTDEDLNEIVTTTPVVSLGTWMHVVFTRSLTDGMHIYVNGEEQNVTVTSGTQNPQGAIKRETELYMGHDAICFIEEIRVSNTALEPTGGQVLWMQWWLWAVVAAVALGVGLFVYYRRRSR
jgi:nitrous oxidase accessory protein